MSTLAIVLHLAALAIALVLVFVWVFSRPTAICSTLFVIPARDAARAGATQWHALPGNRLEYGSSGFTITLNATGPVTELYLLTDPEGRRVSSHYDLHAVKSSGERFARERDEFAAGGLPAEVRAVITPPRQS